MATLPGDFTTAIERHVADHFGGFTHHDAIVNLRALYALATPQQRRTGRRWYRVAREACRAIAHAHGFTLRQVVGITAALSPQHSWPSNIAAAAYVARILAEDPVIELPSELVEERYEESDGVLIPVGSRLSEMTTLEAAWAIMTKQKFDGGIRNSEGKKVTFSCGSGAVARAIMIARGAEPDNVLGGHKVRSFFNNILYPTKNFDVTFDTHALSASTLTKIPSVSETGKKLNGKTPQLAEVNAYGPYSFWADAYRTVAAEVGMRPHEFQATIWIVWKNFSDTLKLRAGDKLDIATKARVTVA